MVTSILGGHTTEDAKWFRGMDMTAKKKLLIAGLLLVAAWTFFFSHFWTYTVFAIQKVVALSIPFLAFTKLVAGIAGVHLLL